MDQILGQIGGTLGGVFGSPVVRFGLQAIGFYLVILWLASAYWAFRDMQQRSDNVILPYLAAALIILFTPDLLHLRGLGLQDRSTAREDRRGAGAQPGRGGAAGGG